ncbi:MAG: helix-turn-helix domain-containing protein, partial [Clostridium sp.]|nr:helix-turn-helix domain-containing protein [Clostridium sp.]
TVMVIPCNSSSSKIKIVSTHELEGLKDFDPKDSYGYDSVTEDADGTKHYYRNGSEFKQMKNTQTEMGKISNLITDMTLKGANETELARAVRHSMVVIDAEKHHLDYKQSEKDNDITSLKKRYQAHDNDDGYGGASTLISRAKSEVSVPKRQGSAQINEDGSLSWKTATDLEYTDPKTGKTKIRTQASTQMAETNDAMTLVSDARSAAELAYAEYANKMKSLANQARKEMVSTGKIEYSSSAAQTYKTEVASLKAKLNVALKNAPRERQAQIIANAYVTGLKQDNPDMTKADIKKRSQQALTAARISTGASRTPVEITDKEWEAIQAGAISENQLMQILDNTNIDTIRERATPRASTELTTAQKNRIKSLAAAGYTTDEIAKVIGKSTSTVLRCLNGKE